MQILDRLCFEKLSKTANQNLEYARQLRNEPCIYHKKKTTVNRKIITYKRKQIHLQFTSKKCNCYSESNFKTRYGNYMAKAFKRQKMRINRQQNE